MIETAFVCMVGGILIGGIIGCGFRHASQLREMHELSMAVNGLLWVIKREKREKQEEVERNSPRGTYYGR